jgi:hypothetical protein
MEDGIYSPNTFGCYKPNPYFCTPNKNGVVKEVLTVLKKESGLRFSMFLKIRFGGLSSTAYLCTPNEKRGNAGSS